MNNSSTINSTANSTEIPSVNNSFIESAISKLAEQKSSTGRAARIVEAQDHKNPANRIALAYLKLSRERLEAAKAEKTTGIRGRDPIVKPEAMLSFVQNVMNQVCWNARRLVIANSAEDFGNGIDFSQDAAEQTGVSSKTENVSQFVDDDFMTLNNVQTWLGAQMPYLNDIEPLFYFAQSEEIDGEWEQTHQSMNFYDAQCAMTEIIESLDDKNVIKQRSEAASIDFSAAA
jgi:hypothetical protein